jgi:hypothetical protein
MDMRTLRGVEDQGGAPTGGSTAIGVPTPGLVDAGAGRLRSSTTIVMATDALPTMTTSKLTIMSSMGHETGAGASASRRVSVPVSTMRSGPVLAVLAGHDAEGSLPMGTPAAW